jgi:hypothetical protein
MTVFRWIIGVLTAVVASGAALSFVIFIATGIDLWLARARKFRHWTFAALMFWFNFEIWRHVILIIVNW